MYHDSFQRLFEIVSVGVVQIFHENDAIPLVAVVKVCALHFFRFSCEFSSMSIYPSNITQLWKIPNVVNRIYRRYKRVGPASQITKIRKAIQHLELIRAIISGVKSETTGMMFITSDRQRWNAFNDSDRSTER